MIKKEKETQLFGRLGNKTNDIKYFKHLLPLDIKNIIEPFGGTFALTREIYDDKKYNKYVNDNDKSLIEIYKTPEDYLLYVNKMNDIALKHIYDDKYVDTKKFMEEIQKEKLNEDKFYNFWKDERIVRGIVKPIKKFHPDKFINVMKQINFTYEDYKQVMDKHKNDETAFIFIDPPYLFSNNKTYEAQRDEQDMTHIIVKLSEYLNDEDVKCKIMIIINDLSVLRWIFKDFIKMTYERVYQIMKIKSTHLVITNY